MSHSTRRLFESRSISLTTRKRMLKTYVWSPLLYGCETWSISDSDRRKLDAFEMWCCRRMLKISWRDHITNEDVLERVCEQRNLYASICRRRAQWLGHVIRYDSIAKIILEGTVEGQCRRGRPRKEFLEQVKTDYNFSSYQELRMVAEDRGEWRRRLLLLQTSLGAET